MAPIYHGMGHSQNAGPLFLGFLHNTVPTNSLRNTNEVLISETLHMWLDTSLTLRRAPKYSRKSLDTNFSATGEYFPVKSKYLGLTAIFGGGVNTPCFAVTSHFC